MSLLVRSLRSARFSHRTWDNQALRKLAGVICQSQKIYIFSFRLKFHEAVSYFPFLVLWEFSFEDVEKSQRTRLSTPWSTTVSNHGNGRQRPERTGWPGIGYNGSQRRQEFTPNALRCPLASNTHEVILYLTNQVLYISRAQSFPIQAGQTVRCPAESHSSSGGIGRNLPDRQCRMGAGRPNRWTSQGRPLTSS